MDRREVVKLLLQLAEGVNPDTGEIYGDDSPYQSPRVIRALFQAVRELELGVIPHQVAAKEQALTIAADEVSPRPGQVPDWKEPSAGRQQLNAEDGLPTRAYAAWSEAEDQELRMLFGASYTIRQLAEHLRRKPGAIESRLAKLGLRQKAL